jgi:hypothetical protein
VLTRRQRSDAIVESLHLSQKRLIGDMLGAQARRASMNRYVARPILAARILAARGALIAATLGATLAACTLGPDPILQADEQRAEAARDKLTLDEQLGDRAAVATDTHALFLAQQQLLHDRGQLTQEDRQFEGGGSGKGGGMGGGGHM